MVFKTLTDLVEKNSLLVQNSIVIVGLSGGPDSVFLLHYLHSLIPTLKLKLVAAHLNHQWRPTADRDQAFCTELCKTLEIPFVSATLDQIALTKKYNGSKEEFARYKRRAFLEKVADEYQADAIALGHHADDQIETFFIRLVRGATIAGLQGMRPKEGRYIRPLLSISKATIVQYLQENQISFCTDETNQDPSFLRNTVRLNLIPTLTTIDPRISKTVLRTIDHLQETEHFLSSLTKNAFERCLVEKQDLDITSFLAEPNYLQNKILIDWLIHNAASFNPSTAFLKEIHRFIKNKKSISHTLSPKWQIIKSGSTLKIIPI